MLPRAASATSQRPWIPHGKNAKECCCCSVIKSCPYGLQHGRPPCPSPSLGVCQSLCSLHQWCYPTISSSDGVFSFCLHSFPTSESFQWVSSSHQGPKDWSFSFSINPSDEQMVKRVIGPQLESLIHILQLVRSMLSSIGFREKHTEYTKHHIGKSFSSFLFRHLD